MIKAGIFDVGGVLITWDNVHITNDVKQTLGLSDEVFTREWERLAPMLDTGELSEEAFWQQFIRATGTLSTIPDQSFFLREFERLFHPNKEVLAIVKQLKQENYMLAILSNTIETHVQFLKKKGIYEDFTTLMFSHMAGIAKPDARIYHRTLEKLGLQPEETFFVDDREENIVAANKIGMHGIVYKDPDQLKSAIRKLQVTI